GRREGAVPERTDARHDLLAGLGTHRHRARDHVRDRALGDARVLGDVAHRDGHGTLLRSDRDAPPQGLRRPTFSYMLRSNPLLILAFPRSFGAEHPPP